MWLFDFLFPWSPCRTSKNNNTKENETQTPFCYQRQKQKNIIDKISCQSVKRFLFIPSKTSLQTLLFEHETILWKTSNITLLSQKKRKKLLLLLLGLDTFCLFVIDGWEEATKTIWTHKAPSAHRQKPNDARRYLAVRQSTCSRKLLL